WQAPRRVLSVNVLPAALPAAPIPQVYFSTEGVSSLLQFMADGPARPRVRLIGPVNRTTGPCRGTAGPEGRVAALGAAAQSDAAGRAAQAPPGTQAQQAPPGTQAHQVSAGGSERAVPRGAAAAPESVVEWAAQ